MAPISLSDASDHSPEDVSVGIVFGKRIIFADDIDDVDTSGSFRTSVGPACAIEAVVQVESRNDPLALHVNRLPVQPPPARDLDDAVRTAEAFIARGYSVDLGLMQVNSRNLSAPA
jgi:hypothetical protein